jgi:hypothetical protein
MRFWVISQFARYESASTWITLSFMDQNLCRLLMPRPKCGRSRPTTAAAAPATSRLVHAVVVMPISSDGRSIAAEIPGRPRLPAKQPRTMGVAFSRSF